MARPKNKTNPAVARRRAPGAGADRPAGRARAYLAAGALAAALVVVGIGALIAWNVVHRPLTTAPNTSELVALDSRLTTIQDRIRPIAAAFTSEPATGVIDVGSYREKIAAVRELVDSTNGLSVTDPDALEVRDLIITGGSQVLDGMDAALDALQSNDASATVAASAAVDDGLSTLQDARDKLDALLGKTSGA